jgi:hypothetical protein
MVRRPFAVTRRMTTRAASAIARLLLLLQIPIVRVPTFLLLVKVLTRR